MKIYIDRGYYKFYPENPMDIILANSRGLELVPHRGFYTFPALATAPTYSLVGKDLATIQYSGSPESIMDKNKWAYSLSLKKIVPISTIMLSSGISFDGNRYLSIGIPQAGAMVGTKGRLKSCMMQWKPESDPCQIQGIELWSIL